MFGGGRSGAVGMGAGRVPVTARPPAAVAPLVSVVIPTRNRPDVLERSVRSALRQQGVRVEVVVVDDGSEPPVAPALLASTDGARVRVVRHQHSRGVAHARNSGVAAAIGEWVAFLDDDDVWAPTKLAQQLALIGADGVAEAACTGALRVRPDLSPFEVERPPPVHPLPMLLQRNSVSGGASTMVVSRAALARAGGFDPQLSILADWDMWIRVASIARIVAVTEPLIGYVVHPASMSHVDPRMRRELALLVRKHETLRAQVGARLDWGVILTWQFRNEMRSGRRSAAARTFARLLAHPRSGGWAGARRISRSAVRRARRSLARMPSVPIEAPAWLLEPAAPAAAVPPPRSAPGVLECAPPTPR